ncbi:MAG: hypothetical protein AAGI52_14280 [Bacteroidota bacterium]
MEYDPNRFTRGPDEFVMDAKMFVTEDYFDPVEGESILYQAEVDQNGWGFWSKLIFYNLPKLVSPVYIIAYFADKDNPARQFFGESPSVKNRLFVTNMRLILFTCKNYDFGFAVSSIPTSDIESLEIYHPDDIGLDSLNIQREGDVLLAIGHKNQVSRPLHVAMRRHQAEGVKSVLGKA